MTNSGFGNAFSIDNEDADNQVKTTIIGLNGTDRDSIPPRTAQIISEAKTVIGSQKKLAELSWLIDAEAIKLGWSKPLASSFAEIDALDPPIVMLASGDPGYFGVARLASELLASGSYRIVPSVSSVSLAFAALGINWEDATVISFHGRPETDSTDELRRFFGDARSERLALLCSPDHSAQFCVDLIEQLGDPSWSISVHTDLGGASQRLIAVDTSRSVIDQLSHLDSLDLGFSVVTAVRNSIGKTASVRSQPSTYRPIDSWHRPSAFDHANFSHLSGPFTKDEVRSVIISKLGIDVLEPSSQIFDLGAGCGTVGIAALALRPDLHLTAIESNYERVTEIETNLDRFGLTARVIHGLAQDYLDALSEAGAVFIGGGGPQLLKIVLSAVPTNARIVYAAASMSHAIFGHETLGNLCQVMISSTRDLKDGSVRLVSDNPVFISWRGV